MSMNSCFYLNINTDSYIEKWASQELLVVKNLPANAGGAGNVGPIPSGGHGNPLQYSCLENSMDRGAQWATFHRVTYHTHIEISRDTYLYTGQCVYVYIHIHIYSFFFLALAVERAKKQQYFSSNGYWVLISFFNQKNQDSLEKWLILRKESTLSIP